MDPGAPLQFDAVPVAAPPGGPLAVELVPAPDPWDVARKLAHLDFFLFLDSAESHAERGRYSYLAGSSDRGFRDYDGPVPTPGTLQTVETFRRAARPFRAAPGLPPFQGGFAGYFGYEWGRHFERIPRPPADEFNAPTLHLGIYEWVVSFDHEQRRAWVVASGNPAMPPELQRQRAEIDLRYVLDILRRPTLPPRPPERADEFDVPAGGLVPQYPLDDFPGVTSNFSRAGYEGAVRRAVEYVHAGDCFQVNLSQRLLAPLREHPLELYGRLRRLNPAPFGAYFDMGDFQILSASPERFLRLHPEGEVETRPIKGTRPRGRTPDEDAALARDLANSPKDRAENVMIVDLLRNDIGRVCEYGSVRVPRVCEVETFRFVHHLVSEVRGKLRPGVGPLELLAAAFPGGSVTGAPKVRAMEIIAELEPTARGPYCGCLGWVGFDGAMDTNILIRTFTAGRGWVQFPVGGGVVADSDPAREYEETLHKAAGLLRSLEKN
jgi:para-aminobenzoate synthetase component 1